MPRLDAAPAAQPIDLIRLVLLDVLVLFLGGLWLAPPGSSFDDVGLATALYAPILVIVLAALVVPFGSLERFVTLCASVLATLVWIDLVFTALQFWPWFTHELDSVWPQNLALAAFSTWWLTAVLICALAISLRGWRKLIALVLPLALIGAPLTVVDRTSAFWAPPPVADDAGGADAAPVGVAEALLYDEPAILHHALANLSARTPGRSNVYFVGFAGNASQDVFMREVEFVQHYFESHFAGPGHTLVLVNNAATEAAEPLATTTALAESLKVIGAHMSDEDVLVLYLSSHGSRESGVNVAFDPFEFDDLDPDTLKQMLDDAHIRQRIVIVSACYAGIFVAPLANPDTLVITAADATHTSFGCSNEADFTYFGRAYFPEGLIPTGSFTEAFARAVPAIRKREDESNFVHSNPQMSLGSNIARTLSHLTAVLPAHGP